MQALDRALFQWVNGWSESLAPFFRFFSEGNKWTSVRLALATILVYLVWRPATRSAAILAMLAWPLANACTDVLKAALPTYRPSDPRSEMTGVHFRVDPLDSFGTASAHSANMMAVAVVFLLVARPWGWPWLVVALLTGLSRVYVGVHFPFQVLLGWMVGAFCAFVLVRSYQAWCKLRKTSEATVS
jgi:undecaprenyl-diphosphatase